MEFSDNEEEVIDLNSIKNKSKSKDKNKDDIKLSRSMKWVKSSIDSISQMVRSENEELEYSEENNENKFGDYDDQNQEDNIENDNNEDNDNNDEDNNDNDNKNNDNDNNEKVDETYSDSNSNKIMHTFIWEEGGNNVKLIGSFSNWKQQFEMEKDEKEQKYKIVLPLNNEIYQYKFIVDGVWKYSKKQNMSDDGKGNINNILDLTKVKVKKDINKKNSNKKSNKSDSNKKNKNKEKKSNNTKDDKNIKNEKKKNIKYKDYGNIYPDENKLTEPNHSESIGKSFNINNETKQKKIGIIKYYKFVPNNSYSSTKSYLNLSSYRHTILNHILFQRKIKKNVDIKFGISYRYREKATTFIYYNFKSKKKI